MSTISYDSLLLNQQAFVLLFFTIINPNRGYRSLVIKWFYLTYVSYEGTLSTETKKQKIVRKFITVPIIYHIILWLGFNTSSYTDFAYFFSGWWFLYIYICLLEKKRKPVSNILHYFRNKLPQLLFSQLPPVDSTWFTLHV